MDFDNPMFLDFLSSKQMIVDKANSGELGPEYISPAQNGLPSGTITYTDKSQYKRSVLTASRGPSLLHHKLNFVVILGIWRGCSGRGRCV
eukprot:3586430-Prymnesium_polylepis.1